MEFETASIYNFHLSVNIYTMETPYILFVNEL